MTQNLYLGADLAPLVRARSVEAMAEAVEHVIRSLIESDAPGRLNAVAELIKAADPHIVALQEVAVWERRGKVLADFGDLLLDRLGNRYRLAAEWKPSPSPDSARGAVEIGNAILVHSGLRAVAKSGEYWGKLSVHHPVAGEVALPRGWVSCDMDVGGHPFRVVNTHLEATDEGVKGAPEVQLAQAAELESGPAKAPIPVILAGDLNSDKKAKGVVPTSSLENLVKAGFKDAWAELHPDDPGLTWRVDDEIAKEDAPFGARLDVVLTRGPVRAVAVERLGSDKSVRTASGKWPSDHLGLLATIEFPDTPSAKPR